MSAWRFRDEVARDIEECTKNLSRAYALLDCNSKTGSRLLQGLPVRRDVARGAANIFLDFLFEIADGKVPDMTGLNPRIVRMMAAKYAVAGVSWADLVEQANPAPALEQVQSRAAA